MESSQSSTDVTLEMYVDFHKKQFGVDKTEADFEQDAARSLLRQGWILSVDLNKDILEMRRTGEYETTFSQHFSAEGPFAALLLANTALRKVLYFEWRSDTVFYCPPNQQLVDPSDTDSPGFDNYLLADVNFVFSDDSQRQWEKNPFSTLSAKLNLSAIAETTSLNHSNRSLIK